MHAFLSIDIKATIYPIYFHLFHKTLIETHKFHA